MTVTVDPARDAEIQAFQARKAQAADALDNAERVLAVASSLKSCGNRIQSIVVRLGESKPGQVTLSETDFRTQFAGAEVTENPPPCAHLTTIVDGVEVVCWLATTTVKPQPKKVQL